MPDLPTTGQPIAITLATGREIPTTVVAHRGVLLELNLPPVLKAGATLRIVWAVKGGAGAADCTVEELPGAPGLCLRPGPPVTAERRALRRSRPAVALAVTANPVVRAGARERSPVRGSLNDISLGGLSFLTTGGIRLGDRVAITLGSPMDAPLMEDVPARIVSLLDRPDGRRLTSCAFDDPARLGDVLTRLVA
jgi:hypothetical protein